MRLRKVLFALFKQHQSVAVGAILIALGMPLQASEGSWQTYSYPNQGFSIDLPLKPSVNTDEISFIEDGSSTLTSYKALDQAKARQFTVFVGQPKERGIYEPESMDAYLQSHLTSMITRSDNGELLEVRRTTFMEMPALSYSFRHTVEGLPFIARGVTFMIDGGYMRLSFWHPASDIDGANVYQKFLETFKLTPIRYQARPSPVTDLRGISFHPPVNWIERKHQTAFDIARLNNLTRTMALIATSHPEYTCAAYQADLERAVPVQKRSTISLDGKRAVRLLTYQDVPKYNVRLANVHYCLDSSLGAVVLIGTEEESMFWRWNSVFEGTAASIRVPR